MKRSFFIRFFGTSTIMLSLAMAGVAIASEPASPEPSTAESPVEFRIAPPPGLLDQQLVALMADLSYGENDFRSNNSAKGLVHDKASLCANRAQGRVVLAIDATDKRASAPDTLRIDLLGRGDFTKAPTAEIKARGNGSYMEISNPKAAFTVEGMDAEAAVSGMYYDFRKMNGPRMLSLRIVSALSAPCRFGEEDYLAAMIDGNSNLSYDDTYRPAVGNRPGGGDFLAVYPLNAKGRTKALAWTTAGNPICIDGTFYDVSCDLKQKTITAVAAETETGLLALDAETWTLMLAGKTGLCVLEGSREAVPVPTGRYSIWGYAISDGKYLLRSSENRRPAVKVESGDQVEQVELLPLRPGVAAGYARGTVEFRFKMTDAAGNEATLYTVKGQRVQPGLEVIDEEGKVIYRAKFEFG